MDESVFTRGETICAILVASIMGNTHVNYHKFGPVVQEILFNYKMDASVYTGETGKWMQVC